MERGHYDRKSIRQILAIESYAMSESRPMTSDFEVFVLKRRS
jgi:hypothetical protein